MDNYLMLAARVKNESKERTFSRGRTSDIIEMSQDISGRWLQKEAEKKVVSQEQGEEPKHQSSEEKPQNNSEEDSVK